MFGKCDRVPGRTGTELLSLKWNITQTSYGYRAPCTISELWIFLRDFYLVRVLLNLISHFQPKAGRPIPARFLSLSVHSQTPVDFREEIFNPNCNPSTSKPSPTQTGLFDEVSHRLSIESQALRCFLFVSHPISHAMSKDVLENKSTTTPRSSEKWK